MSRLFYHVMQDNAGNLLFDVSGTMRVAGSGTLATIYGDEELTVILPNPMTNHASFGSFKCYLGAGTYDFYMAKGGYTFETLTGVQGHGTMALQNANAVAITGGTVTAAQLWTAAGTTTPKVVAQDITGGGVGNGFIGYVTAGTGRFNLLMEGTAQNFMRGPLGLGPMQSPPYPNARLSIDLDKTNFFGIFFKHSSNDTGPAQPVLFKNLAGTDIGSIATTATATAFNTSSDVRLKHSIAPLTDALAVLAALRPVAFRWQADDSPGQGFLAHELMQVVPAAVTGEADAVHDDGSVKPQGVDHSKLVPWLTACCQALAQQVEALTARVAVLEAS